MTPLRKPPKNGYTAAHTALIVFLSQVLTWFIVSVVFVSAFLRGESPVVLSVAPALLTVFSTAASIGAWKLLKKAGERIAEDVDRSSAPQTNPVVLDVLFPEGSIYHPWPEGKIIIANGVTTIASNDSTLGQWSNSQISVRFKWSGLHILTPEKKFRINPFPKKAASTFRLSELLKFRAEELKVALNNKQPAWIIMETAALPYPIQPLWHHYQQEGTHPKHYTEGYTPPTSPGWYTEHNNPDMLRWWNGTQWTEHTTRKLPES